MKIRLVIWCLGCLAVSVLAFSELWIKLPQRLSPEGLQRYGVFHWGVLGLCILWLWLKRKTILPGMRIQQLSLPFVIAGGALIALSVLLPTSDDFLLFLMLLGWLGVFAIVFNKASVIPAILLAIYGFSIVFPLSLSLFNYYAVSVSRTVYVNNNGVFYIPFLIIQDVALQYPFVVPFDNLDPFRLGIVLI